MKTTTYDPRRATTRNLSAECRAVEEGHCARIDANRGVFVVTSDTHPDRSYDVVANAVGTVMGYVVTHCTCPAGRRRLEPGDVGCKHAALVCRRLEREGLAAFDGRRWVTTERCDDLPAVPDSIGCRGCGDEITDTIHRSVGVCETCLVEGLK